MFPNLIVGNDNTFIVDVSGWSVSNGTIKRGIGYGPYGFTYDPTDTVSVTTGNIMVAVSDGVGVTTLTSSSFEAREGVVYYSKVLTSTNLYTALREGFAEIEVIWFDGDSNAVPQSPASSTRSNVTNSTDPALFDSGWFGVSVYSEAPNTALTGKLFISFSSTTASSGTSVGDEWAIFDPSVVDTSTVGDNLVNSLYASLPEFMLEDDAIAIGSKPLYGLATTLSSSAGAIAQLARSFTYTRALESTDGVAALPALTDPATVSPSAMAWLASMTGVSLVSAGSVSNSWSILAGAGGTWTDWEESIVPGGVGNDTVWSAIEGFGIGATSLDPLQLFRDQLQVGLSGINAGRSDTIRSFIRKSLNSTTPDSEIVEVMKRKRGNPFLVDVNIDTTTDPDPSGDLLQSILSSAAPAGSRLTLTSSSTPLATNAREQWFSDSSMKTGAGIVAGAAEFGAQGISNTSGGTSSLSLVDSVNHTDPMLGGVLTEAPFRDGMALRSGYLAAATSGTSAVLDPVGDFDIFVEMSGVTAPTIASGGGTESGIEARKIASGNHWVLRMLKDQTVSLWFDGTVAADTVVSTVSYDFASETADRPVWVRVQKVGENVSFYVQHDLYDDWSLNQLGTTVPLTATNGTLVSAGAAAYVKILESTVPSPTTNAYDMSLSCTVHRLMLFTGALAAGGWIAGSGPYNYTDTEIDVDFSKVLVRYTTSFTESSINALTITVGDDASVTNVRNVHTMALSTAAGTTFYLGKSPNQFNGANPAAAGDSLTALVTNATYDWKMTYVDTSTDGTLTSTGTGVAASGGTGITWDADTYGDRSIVQIEVVATGAAFDLGNDVAMFLPTTIPEDGSPQEGVVAGVDADTVTWNLNRAYDVIHEYLPSCIIDRDFMHLQEGALTIKNTETLQISSHFSYAVVARKFFSGVTSILTHFDSAGKGVLLRFNVDTIEGSVTSGADTIGPITWDENAVGRTGKWNLIVLRYDPITGLSLNINGVEEAISTTELTTPLTGTPSDIVFGEAGFKKDFATSAFMLFDRYLTDAECVALTAEMAIV